MEDESKRQGEGELRKEEEGMLGRVLGTGGKGEEGGGKDREKAKKPEEERDDKATGRGGGGGMKEYREKMRKGWCDQCKEGCGKKEGMKDTEQEEGAQNGEEEEVLQGAAETTKGKDLQRKRKEAVERSEWGEEGWREAGIEPAVPETPVAGELELELELELAKRRVGVGAGFGVGSGQKTRTEEEAGEDPILLNALKGLRSLPRFCNLCKIHGHNDLTCHLQGNAPTPEPSRHQKPFKTIQQRTLRRGLGAPRGSMRTGKEGGRRELALTKRERIVFEKEREAAPSRKELGELELELEVERPKPELREEGGEERRKGVERDLGEEREKGKNVERQK